MLFLVHDSVVYILSEPFSNVAMCMLWLWTFMRAGPMRWDIFQAPCHKCGVEGGAAHADTYLEQLPESRRWSHASLDDMIGGATRAGA